MNPADLPIGIFDSGVGGLTVMKAILDTLPKEKILYLADTGHLPYGSKSKETIVELTIQNSRFLISQGIKALVIACHTASTYALEPLKKLFDLPIIGMIEATRKELRSHAPIQEMALLATQGTIASGVYQEEIKDLFPACKIHPIACPLLVTLAEEGVVDHPQVDLALKEYIDPVNSGSLDALLLACTHFPLFKKRLRQKFSSQMLLLDPSLACAEELKKRLMEKQLLSQREGAPEPTFFVSAHPDQFQKLGSQFLQRSADDVRKVRLVDAEMGQ